LDQPKVPMLVFCEFTQQACGKYDRAHNAATHLNYWYYYVLWDFGVYFVGF